MSNELELWRLDPSQDKWHTARKVANLRSLREAFAAGQQRGEGDYRLCGEDGRIYADFHATATGVFPLPPCPDLADLYVDGGEVEDEPAIRWAA